MDPLAAHPAPTASSQANGTLSPPPTPALNGTTGRHSHGDANGDGHNVGLGFGGVDRHDKLLFPNGANGHHNGSPFTRPPDSPNPTPRPSPSPKRASTFTSVGVGEFGTRHDHYESHAIPTIGPHDQEPGGPQSRGRAKIRAYTDDKHLKEFPRLSKPVELLRSSYDVIVIGSGYGGGVAASRMARTGQSVCVLERGREKWPGEYPTGMRDSLEELHYSGNFAPGFTSGKLVEGGDPTGMFHLIFGKGQNAVVCNGLGGTSLMNANVFMEADKGTLAMKAWPPEIRNNVDLMDKYYEKVDKVLKPQEYPDDWPELPKLNLLKKQADILGYGEKFKKVRQTTRFHNGPNSCGVEMSASALTGQDCTGVNDGSKTTTLVTYLADAWNWGAEMFCECEVRYIEKAKNAEGYIIYFAWHGRNRGHFKANLHGDLMWVHAKKAVFLGAGAIGTTEILLRSKAMGLEMSDRVGQNMSGNGDILAFGYNTDETANGIGRPYPSPYHPIGPTINGVIDCRSGHENPLDGFVIEEGAVPHALSHLLQTMLDLMPGSAGPKDDSIVERTQAALARYGSRFLGPYFKRGAIERTQVYLIMSHDSNQAMLTLEDDKPVLEFLGVGRSDHVKHLNGLLARATEAVGGTLVQNPFFALMGQQQVTVHPIGGACMARDNTGQTGVTNHVGQVFTGTGGEVHSGLVVTDAAVIPTALGANPFATIAALAERSVEAYAKSQNLEINEEKNEILDLFGEPKHLPHARRREQQKMQYLSVATPTTTVDSVMEEEQESIQEANKVIRIADQVKASGLGFTEVMSGFIHYDPNNLKEDKRETYERAFRTAKSLCESARFFLSVQAFDTHDMVRDSTHRGMLTGTFVCPSIPGSPFMVQRGEFNLFILDHKAPGTRNLTYDFDMTGVNGKKLHFHGYKVVDSSVALAPLQFWRSTSTLYVTISEHFRGMCDETEEGQEAWRRARVLGKGIMHIQPTDFLSEIMTLTPTGSNLLKKVASAASFLTFFTRKSMSLFLAPFTPLQYPSQTYSGYINDTPPRQSIAIYASDKVCTRMHVWEPTAYPDNDPQNIRNLFMIPGAAVDHQIYALPTIPFNAVNYFTRAGYRVFITVHRIGQLMVAENNWTTFDARLDIKACLEHIRAHYSPDPIYTVAHCMGSVAFSCGLLDGTIPSSWILGITCSQVFMNPMWNTINLAKVMVGYPLLPMDRLYTLLAGRWFSCSTSPDDSYVQRGINQLLRLYPQSRREICNNAACHRTSLVFGRCWNHSNLNEATHRQIDRFFGGVNMRLLHLLMKMGAEGHVMTNAPLCDTLTTPQNIQRLRGIPIMLFVGRDNAVLSPESTERTYEILCDTFGGAAQNVGGHSGGLGGSSGGLGGSSGGLGGTSSGGLGGSSGLNVSGEMYTRRVVPGYGHLDPWMGRNAWKDVYPFVREEVDRVVRGESYRFEEPHDKFKRMVDEGELLY